jgi:O-antigen biosynthesis protein
MLCRIGEWRRSSTLIGVEMVLDNIVDMPRRSLRRRKPDVVTLADRARDAGQWELAAQLYRQALDRDPRNPPIWVQYGHALKESGELRDPEKLAQAEVAYRRALSLDPGMADTFLQLGHVLKLQGETEEAQAAYLRAFALDRSMPYTLDELSGLGWSKAEVAELQALVEIQRSDASTPAIAEDSQDRPTVVETGWRLTTELRRYIAERFLSIDLNWAARRHGAMPHPPFAEAAQAAADVRRRLLQEAGVDFSPFVSVRRLSDQYPDYDFSSGEFLIDFIESRLPTSAWASPHWLFDGRFYGGLYPEPHGSKRVGYFGFLLSGVYQSRRPHPLFNQEWYASRRTAPDGNPAFFHFLLEGIFDDLSPTPLFDPEFYRAMYPQVSAGIANGTYACSLEHFVCQGSAQGLLPSADWDPDYYLTQNPDVAEGAASGGYGSALNHWLEHGIAENRSPNAQFDGHYYLENYPSVGDEMKRYNLLGPFEHFAIFGRQRRWRARAPLHTVAVPIDQAKALYLKRCELSVFAVRTGGAIRFTCEERPFFSVIISAYNNFAYNIRVLELLEHAAHYTKSRAGIGIEVVVVDNGSSDETVRLEDYAEGIVFRSVSPNIGFPRACNLGASLCSGTYLVFLNNDVEFAPDVFVRLYEAIQKDKGEVACFGAGILQFDGTIQDLGSGIWRDGVAQGYFSNEVPTRYAFSHPLDVDYVAGCFFCISAAEFKEYGGFDERYSPGYYEESDLALRLSRAGRKSRVYPDVRIYHLEFGAFSAGTTPRASIALMARNRVLFAREHKDLLESRAELGAHPSYAARHADCRLRLLFIEHTVPSIKMGSGYGRSEINIRHLLELADVDLFACYREDYMIMPEDFQYLDIWYGPEAEKLDEVLDSRHYDAVYICRAPSLARYDGVLSAWKRRTGGIVVCDTEAIAAIRDTSRQSGGQSYQAITSDAEFDAFLDKEFHGTGAADMFVAVNEFESAVLRRRFARPVHVIGHHMPIKPMSSGLAGRTGLLFLGALDSESGPNYDGVHWFLTRVWPKIRAKRPTEQLRIAGLVRRGVSLERLRGDGVVHVGPIDDPATEFALARVFIAPTRFAAGIPFKVQEALSYGLPVVASRLLNEQLSQTGEFADVLLATTVNDDGRAFADACLELLTDDALWLQKREAGLAYVSRYCAPRLLTDGIERLLRDLNGSLRPAGTDTGNPIPGSARVQRRIVDLPQWQTEVELETPAQVALERPIGIFVHLFYEELADEIAGHLAKIDLPKKIYISTDSEEKRKLILHAFEQHDLGSILEIIIVPNYGQDIAPLLIECTRKFFDHEICLKIHSKRSLHSPFEFGEGWRTYLYNQLIGNADRVRSIVNTMLANPDLGVMLPQHWHGVVNHANIGPNYDKMQKILSSIAIDLFPGQELEFPSGSMFWFRSEALAGLADLCFDWLDFGHALEEKDGTLQHGMERCFLFFCAHAGKRWALLPSF